MTAILLALLAAVGIGGSLAAAGGGGSSSEPAVSDSVVPGEENLAANLNPNYELISFLADDQQYTVTAATEDTLQEEVQNLQSQSVYGAALKMKSAAKSRENEEQKNTFIKDFVLRGGITDDGKLWALNLKPQDGAFTLSKYENGEFSKIGMLAADNNANQSPYYDTYRLDDKNNTTPSKDESGHIHYDVIHLGGAKSKLTVADFGRWESADLNIGLKSENQDRNLKISGSNEMRTFFLYDEKYAYKGNRRDEVKMQGNVLVATPDTIDLGLSHLMLTGNIFMDLNLATNRLTGTVTMNEIATAKYNIDSFSGSILGSLVLFAPQGEDFFYGGVGKLLSGKNGLEMVGQLTKRDDSSNKIDYTFGSWEVSPQAGELAIAAAQKLNPNYDLITVLADKAQYKRVIVNIPREQDKMAWVEDGTLKNRWDISITEKEGTPALSILTGKPSIVDGEFNRMETAVSVLWTKADHKESTPFYDHYQNSVSGKGSWPGSSEEQEFTYSNDLYLAGAQTGLTVADFGYWNELRNFWHDDKYYRNLLMYDASFLYTGDRKDTVRFEGQALMLKAAEEKDLTNVPYNVYGGVFTMNLDLAKASLQGKIDMGAMKETGLDFTGRLNNGHKFSFTSADGGANIHPLSYGFLLQGKEGLEAVGIIATLEGNDSHDHINYTFGAKEVK